TVAAAPEAGPSPAGEMSWTLPVESFVPPPADSPSPATAAAEPPTVFTLPAGLPGLATVASAGGPDTVAAPPLPVAPPPPRRRRLWLWLSLALLQVGIAGGAYLYFVVLPQRWRDEAFAQGEKHLARGRIDPALSSFAEALRQDDQFAPAHRERAVAFNTRG